MSKNKGKFYLPVFERSASEAKCHWYFLEQKIARASLWNEKAIPDGAKSPCYFVSKILDEGQQIFFSKKYDGNVLLSSL